MGMGIRAIQFLAIIRIPLLLVLALEGLIERSALGALIGTLLGFIFSKIGEAEKNEAGEQRDQRSIRAPECATAEKFLVVWGRWVATVGSNSEPIAVPKLCLNDRIPKPTSTSNRVGKCS